MMLVKEKSEKCELQLDDMTCWKVCYVLGIYTRMHYTKNWDRTFFSTKYYSKLKSVMKLVLPYYKMILHLFYNHATQEEINA